MTPPKPFEYKVPWTERAWFVLVCALWVSLSIHVAWWCIQHPWFGLFYVTTGTLFYLFVQQGEDPAAGPESWWVKIGFVLTWPLWLLFMVIIPG